MKPLSLLLGVSMLCMSWFVCPDNSKGAANPGIKITGAGRDQPNDHEEKNCCAFCTCSGYVSENFKPQGFSIPELVFSNNAESSLFLYSEIAEIIFPIWHPPQFGA